MTPLKRGSHERDVSYKLVLREQLASAFCDGPECVAPEPLERDPLLSELQARVAEMEADCGAPSRRTLALRRGVETCFETLNVELTSDLDAATVKVLMATAPSDICTLLSVHSNEGAALVEQHLTHVACETEPIVMGRYLLRMPPMVGGGSIAVPHLFLSQIYAASICFGYCLARAEQQQALEGVMGGAAAAASQNLPKGGKEGERFAIGTLGSFLYQDGRVKASALCVAGRSATAAAAEQTQQLFGSRQALLAQVDQTMLFVKSPEEAQESLDQAMRDGTIPWLRLSSMGLRRLMLEAVAFGMFLWDTELLMDVELRCVDSCSWDDQ